MKKLQAIVIVLAIVVATIGLVALRTDQAKADLRGPLFCNEVTCPGEGGDCTAIYTCGMTCVNNANQGQYILPTSCCSGQFGAYCQF